MVELQLVQSDLIFFVSDAKSDILSKTMSDIKLLANLHDIVDTIKNM